MASEGAEFDAVIESVDRLNNSANGNPRYRVHLRGGDVLQTKPDAAINYGISNSDVHNVPVRITTDGKNQITYVTKEGEHI